MATVETVYLASHVRDLTASPTCVASRPWRTELGLFVGGISKLFPLSSLLFGLLGIPSHADLFL